MTTALIPSDARPTAGVTPAQVTRPPTVAWAITALTMLTLAFALFAVLLVPDTQDPSTVRDRPGPAATATLDQATGR